MIENCKLNQHKKNNDYQLFYISRNIDQEIMITSEKNIAVNPITCSNSPCNETCSTSLCSLCLQCLSKSDIIEMQRAFSENQAKGSMKRLFPSKLQLNQDNADELTKNNRISVMWFQEKCRQNVKWC